MPPRHQPPGSPDGPPVRPFPRRPDPPDDGRPAWPAGPEPPPPPPGPGTGGARSRARSGRRCRVGPPGAPPPAPAPPPPRWRRRPGPPPPGSSPSRPRPSRWATTPAASIRSGPVSSRAAAPARGWRQSPAWSFDGSGGARPGPSAEPPPDRGRWPAAHEGHRRDRRWRPQPGQGQPSIRVRQGLASRASPTTRSTSAAGSGTRRSNWARTGTGTRRSSVRSSWAIAAAAATGSNGWTSYRWGWSLQSRAMPPGPPPNLVWRAPVGPIPSSGSGPACSRRSARSGSGWRAPRPAWPAGAARGRPPCGPRRSTRSPTPG